MERSSKHPPASDPSLGRLLKRRREQAGLSLRDLAERAGCTPSYLSQVETGVRGVPSHDMLIRLEEAMGVPAGELTAAGDRERGLRAGGDVVRRAFDQARRQDHVLRLLRRALAGDAPHADKVASLRSVVESLTDPMLEPEPEPGVLPIPLPTEVPLINKVAAGYPTDFTDLAYPARVADEYIRCPDLNDPDAFAARVVGRSMEPDYNEGDVVVFSPALPVVSGMDCFARLEPDHETTFKRVFFDRDAGKETVRLQPLNPAFAPRVYEREQVAGLFAAVSVIRRIRAPV